MTHSTMSKGAQLRSTETSGSIGLALAGITALVSGVSVFVNSYGVRAISSPAVYTTAKNLVAFLVLAAISLAGRHSSGGAGIPGLRPYVDSPAVTASQPARIRLWTWIGLAYVGIVGGGLAFVLFFVGLAHTGATPAAFWHDTLVVWVAALAPLLLGERLRWWNVAAVWTLLVGQIALTRGVGHLAADRGQMLVLAATLLWSVEVVVARRMLQAFSPASLSMIRMGIGGVALLGYLVVTGKMHLLLAFGGRQMSWTALTGLLLAVYVATWMTALARARAVDVSSVLVASVFVTALLQDAAGTARIAPQLVGLVLVALGTGLVLTMGLRNRAGTDVSKADRAWNRF